MKYFKTMAPCILILFMVLLFSIHTESFGAGGEELVYYNRATTVYPLMNGETYKDINFLNKYIGESSVYNIAPAFKFSFGSGASSLPSNLAYGTSFTHKNDDETYFADYHYTFEDNFIPTATKGDLYLSFMANLTNDKHWNIKRHTYKKTAYPVTLVGTFYGTLIKHSTEDYENDTTVSRGTFNFVPVGIIHHYCSGGDGLLFRARGEECTCGSSKVSNIRIMLADVVGPRVQSIYTTCLKADGITMEKCTKFKAGEELYINLEFDENIRFADDQAMTLASAPKLKFKVKRITDNIQETGITAEASLVSLDTDLLTFKYLVPETYSVYGNTVNTNYYIYAIEPYSNQTSWVSSTKSFDLKLFGKNGSYLNEAKQAASCVVDLAGNPINIGTSTVKLDSPAYLDNVAPTVTTIKIVRPPKKDSPYGSELNNSDVFASIGEKVGFFVDFSEEVGGYNKAYNSCFPFDYWVNRLQAQLNISESGVPVTATAKYMTMVNNKNGNQISRVYFEMDKPVSANMVPIIYDGQQLPIAINRIYEEDFWYEYSDTRGNFYAQETKLVDAADGERIMPEQQFWLDTTAPLAATSFSIGGNGCYQPAGYTVGNNPSAFYFPVKVSDQNMYGEEYMSLTNGAKGAFMWRDNMGNPVDYAYEYAVTGSADQPADTAYQPSTTGQQNPFTQLDTGNYIHIRLLDGVNYNIGDSDLVIYPADYAGNVGEAAFAIDYQMDLAGPLITMDSCKKQYIGGDLGGSLITVIGVRDVSDLSTVEYQWTELGAEAAEANWSSAAIAGEAVTLGKDNLAYGGKYQYTLHLRSADVLGYKTSASFDYEYDLTKIAYNIEFTTDPKAVLKQHSARLFLPDSGTGTAPDGVADRLMVLVKKPDSPEHYWARSFSYADICGEANAVDIFEINAMNVNEWTSVVKTLSETPAEIPEAAYFYEHTPLSEAEKAELLKGFYRQVELTVIARRPAIVYEPETYIPLSENRTEDLYTFNFANGDVVGSSVQIHQAEITAKSVVTSDSYVTNPEVTSVVPVQPNPPHSLDGAVFTVSALGNQQVADYGLADIDFASADTHFALYKTGTIEASEVSLFTAPLIPKVSQDIAIPCGMAGGSGSYKAVVSIKCKNSDHIDQFEYTEILIDRRKVEASGVTQVKTTGTLAQGSFTLPETVTDYADSLGHFASEIYVSAEPGVTHSLTLMADLPDLGFTTNTEYIKVWNATVAEASFDLRIPESSYRWIAFPAQSGCALKTMLLNQTTKGILESNLASNNPHYAATIPIVPGENVINYQIATTAGYISPVQTLLVQVGDDIPVIEMSMTPYLTDGTATKGDVAASIHALSSMVDPPDTLHIGVVLPADIRYEGDPTADFNNDHQLTLPENGDYYFYVYDKYHSFGYQKVTIDYIDKSGPSFMVTDYSNADQNTFDFEIELKDNFNTDDCKVYLGFDEAYCALLGVAPGTFFEVPTTDWVADELSPGGIYQTTVTTNGEGAKVISVSGAFRYDTSAGVDVNRRITLSAEDGVGNKGGIWYGTIGQYVFEEKDYIFDLYPRNEAAAYVSGVLTASGFEATFNKPVLLMLPNESTAHPLYAHTKANLPYFTNGVYPVKFRDLFGDLYEGNLKIDQFEDLYNCTVSISETEPTNQDVQVLINAAFNPDITLELPASITGGTVDLVRNGQGAVVGASITMSQNGTILFGLKPVDNTKATQMRSLNITNIDKIPPAVELEWVYTAEVSDGKTEGDLIVSLKSDEELEPMQNTSTTHTFTFYDQAPYTFHFTDLAGNSGSITAVLPVEIIEKPLVELDTTPPDYELSIYQSIEGASIKVAGYKRTAYELLADKADAFPLFAGTLRLCFRVYDDNQTSLSIKEGLVPGVAVSGMNVTVSDNAEFTVVLTDAKGNFTEVPVCITQADNVAPTGEITYVRINPLTIRGYLTMTDNFSKTVTLKNTNGVQLNTEEGLYKGKYYHEFLDNESFTFVFTDEAGNSGNVTAAVTTLDVTAPVGTVTQWVPYFIDESGTAHKNQLAETITNSDVSVYIQFNKPIRSVTPAIMDEIGSLENVFVTQTEDSATVVFRRNAKVKLTYTALNTLSGSMVLEVNIIDKTAPTITAFKSHGDAKSVTYTFTADEQVFFEDGDELTKEGLREPGTSFSKVLELNGTYDFKFTDRAGNSATKRVEVISEIDRTAPGVSVENLPATRENVDAYNLANGTSIKHMLTNQSITIEASMDEAGTITFQGVSHPVSAGEKVPLTIAYNGVYEIVAADLAGMTTRYRFKIDCIDKSKPQIHIFGGTFSIRQGTLVTDFAAKALAPENVRVTDNYDPSPAVTLSKALTAEQLNTPGTYSIEYTATDTAGNQQTASFFVRVYDRNEVEVWLNGALAQPGETLFVGGKNARAINVTVDNLPAGSGGSEPYKMYWKPGLNTPGQMKNAAVFSDSFTAPRDGLYTLYIVTQGRESFITYIYVQQ